MKNIELRDYIAMKILQGLMLRHKEDGYSDRGAIYEAYKLADEAIGIRKAKITEGIRTPPPPPPPCRNIINHEF